MTRVESLHPTPAAHVAPDTLACLPQRLNIDEKSGIRVKLKFKITPILYVVYILPDIGPSIVRVLYYEVPLLELVRVKPEARSDELDLVARFARKREEPWNHSYERKKIGWSRSRERDQPVVHWVPERNK